MLSQLTQLGLEVEGRYATDGELNFLSDYIQSYGLRLQTYQKLQTVERQIVQQVLAKMKMMEPSLLQSGGADISGKWKQDTIRILRYSAIALLLDDPASLRERLLFWMQTIMRAFGAQRSCDITYTIMQDVVKQHLTPMQVSLFSPILELNRHLLSSGTK